MQRKKFGVLLAATSNCTFVLGTQLVNLQFICGDSIDKYYILSDAFSEQDKEAIAKVLKGYDYSLITFTKDDFINNVCGAQTTESLTKTTVASCLENTTFKRYTHMSFGRFEALKYLDECETIVYLDFDMLIQKNLITLKELTKDNDVAMCLGSVKLEYGLGSLCPSQFKNIINYSSGIMVFNQSLQQHNIYQQIYDFIAQNIKNFFTVARLPDQALFNLLILQNQLKVNALNAQLFYGNVGWILSKDAYIIHAHGAKNRFWNHKYVAQAYPLWYICYLKWQALGGKAVDAVTEPKIAGLIYKQELYRDLMISFSNIKVFNLPISFDLTALDFIKILVPMISNDFYIRFYMKNQSTCSFAYIMNNKVMESTDILINSFNTSLLQTFIETSITKYIL